MDIRMMINSTDDDDNSSDDGLWNHFENCAQEVTNLYRNPNWRTLQSAAASATQLYKGGIECKKRSLDRGFKRGRQALAKELAGMCRHKNKLDVGEVIALLSRYDLLPSGDCQLSKSPPRGAASGLFHHNHHLSIDSNSASAGALNVFQQALCTHSPNHAVNGGVVGRGGSTIELTSFLQNQVRRHRKRSHSPGGGAAPQFDQHSANLVLAKRLKRL